MKEKVETAQLLGNVRVKLRTYGLRGYEPPEGLRIEVSTSGARRTRTNLWSLTCRRLVPKLQDVAAKWEDLLRTETELARLVEASIARCVGVRF